MILINLLPWREQLREERKRQFFMGLILTIMVAGVLVFLAGQYLNLKIDNQVSRNNYLSDQIKVMDERIKLIEELKAKKAELLERTRIIQDLQSNRQILARILDQFVVQLPDGVFFTSLVKKEKLININGVTIANSRVSDLMRNFEKSQWLASPVLTTITRINKANQSDKTSSFSLVVNESSRSNGGAQ